MRTDWERFRDAVLVLAGAGPLKQRLADAFIAHLREIQPDALPPEVQSVFADVCAALTSGPKSGTLNPVAASVLKMSEADAARHAQCIVTVFAGLHEQHPAHPANRTAALLRSVPKDSDDLPAFLNRA